jgi:hypothetical protein
MLGDLLQPTDRLPHGAKGIDGEDFIIDFGADKIVFVPKSAGAGAHYTLHTGPDSGVIDLHETQPGPDQHRTLFALHHEDLPALLGDTAAILPELLGLNTISIWFSQLAEVGVK